VNDVVRRCAREASQISDRRLSRDGGARRRAEARKWQGGGGGRRGADSASLAHARWDLRCVVERLRCGTAARYCGRACAQKAIITFPFPFPFPLPSPRTGVGTFGAFERLHLVNLIAARRATGRVWPRDGYT
jgi:hypothetical protein